MEFHRWSSRYETGIEVIDNQHKELLEKINSVYSSVRSGNKKVDQEDVISFISKYVVEHFALEEELMKECSYPGYEEHLQIHKKFTLDFEKILNNYNNGLLNPVSLISFLFDFFINHIEVDDANYVPSLLKHRKKNV